MPARVSSRRTKSVTLRRVKADFEKTLASVGKTYHGDLPIDVLQLFDPAHDGPDDPVKRLFGLAEFKFDKLEHWRVALYLLVDYVFAYTKRGRPVSSWPASEQLRLLGFIDLVDQNASDNNSPLLSLEEIAGSIRYASCKNGYKANQS